MKFGFVVPVVVLAAGVIGAAALIESKPQSAPLKTKEKVWSVDVAAVSPSSHRPELTLFGRVESPRAARLTAALSADVVAVDVLEGDYVKARQTLVRLDDRESRLLLRQRQAEHAEIAAQIDIENQRNANDKEALERERRVLTLARRAVKRAQDLAKTNVGSRSQLDSTHQEQEQRSMAVDARRTALEGHASRMAQLAARLARAQALEDRARLDVERSIVTAPFTGPIYNVAVSPGDRVQPGTALVGLYDASALELRAQIPAAYLPRVRAALASKGTIDGSARVDAQQVSAVLARLGAQVTRGSGGVDGLFRVSAGGQWLQIGRTVELTVKLPIIRNAIAIPSQALYGNKHVYRITDGRMQRIDVDRIGEFESHTGRRILIRSTELDAGDQVIVTQLPNAIDGLRVSATDNS
jgi:RND family efflux transporter MFP subunit